MTISYLVVPVTFFTSLRQQLSSQLSDAAMDTALYESGKASARLIFEDAIEDGLGPSSPDEEFEVTLFNLLMEAGLGRSRIDSDSQGKLIVINEEAPESSAGGCFYTTGFLAGALTMLRQSPHSVTELQCGKGEQPCRYEARSD